MAQFHDQEWGRLLLKQTVQSITRANTSIVLKGGTALMLCYGLARFSEDIDLDSRMKPGNFKGLIERSLKETMKFIPSTAFSVSSKKDTETTCRVVCNFENGYRLKVELKANVAMVPRELVEVDGIRTYTIDRLAQNKLDCILGSTGSEPRTTARDLHDIAFICRSYKEDLSAQTAERLGLLAQQTAALLDRYMVVYEEDPLVNTDLLRDLADIRDFAKKPNRPDLEATFPV